LARVPPNSPSASAQRGDVTSAPALLCASVQLPPGHHMARSTTMGTAGFSDRTIADVATSESPGSLSTQTVNRLWAPRKYCRVILAPPMSRYVISTVVSDVVGLASRMNRSKNGPVAPSARNQLVAAVMMPALLCPAANRRPCTVMYIARSTRIWMLLVDSICAETSVFESSVALDGAKRSLSTFTVRRARGLTV
jgi:hypothetical protein